ARRDSAGPARGRQPLPGRPAPAAGSRGRRSRAAGGRQRCRGRGLWRAQDRDTPVLLRRAGSGHDRARASRGHFCRRGAARSCTRLRPRGTVAGRSTGPPDPDGGPSWPRATAHNPPRRPVRPGRGPATPSSSGTCGGHSSSTPWHRMTRPRLAEGPVARRRRVLIQSDRDPGANHGDRCSGGYPEPYARFSIRRPRDAYAARPRIPVPRRSRALGSWTAVLRMSVLITLLGDPTSSVFVANEIPKKPNCAPDMPRAASRSLAFTSGPAASTRPTDPLNRLKLEIVPVSSASVAVRPGTL